MVKQLCPKRKIKVISDKPIYEFNYWVEGLSEKQADYLNEIFMFSTDLVNANCVGHYGLVDPKEYKDEQEA
jgi:hypothetical protein